MALQDGPDGRCGAVVAPTMVDVQHVDGLGLLIDAIADAVLASTGPPLPLDGLPQRHAHHARIGSDRTEDELDACRGHRFGQLLGEPASGAASHNDPIRHRDGSSSSPEGRLRTAGSPRTWPAAISASATCRRPWAPYSSVARLPYVGTPAVS